MTPTREEMVLLAKSCGFSEVQMRAMFYLSGPYDIEYPTSKLESFYRAAFAKGFAAGQSDLRETVAKWHDEVGWLLDEDDVPDAIRALPIDGEIIGNKGENE